MLSGARGSQIEKNRYTEAKFCTKSNHKLPQRTEGSGFKSSARGSMCSGRVSLHTTVDSTESHQKGNEESRERDPFTFPGSKRAAGDADFNLLSTR